MLPKLLIVLAMLAIAYTLGSSFWFLIRDKGEGTATVRRLTWRVGLSLLLFMMILLALAAGWVKPSSPGPIHYPVPEQAGPGD